MELYIPHSIFHLARVLYVTPETFVPYYVCVLYLSQKKSDLCHLQHKLIGFYNRDEKCLLRGTNWVFK